MVIRPYKVNMLDLGERKARPDDSGSNNCGSMDNPWSRRPCGGWIYCAQIA